MEIGFIDGKGNYSQATMPEGTEVVPVRPSADHVWKGKKWILPKDPGPEPTSLPAPEKNT